MITFLWIIAFIALVLLLAYKRASLIVWTISLFIYLLLATKFSQLGAFSSSLLWLIFLAIAVPLNILPLRRHLISRHLLAFYRKVKPHMSQTEKEALAVGTVGWEGEIFTGMPNWQKLLAYPAATLSAEERAFLEGPVEELCQQINNWDIVHNRFNLPDEMWQFLKKEGFFGIIIPKKYGGKQFSAIAHSEIITKIASRSITVATVVAVPNSLGPAELLLEYGTEEQKEHYLPKLATGEEMPCFALTGPEAGSDASAMPDYGVVCKQMLNGKETLGVRLNWNKRYITLAPVATILGLAFKLYDPDHLIGDVTDIGITCALVPTNTPGVVIGRRHYPANSAFPNGPTQGENVFVPIEAIIGGVGMVGQGWRMLIERLSVGRAISLPSMVMGGAKVAAYATGAYARIRKQFNLPIGRFEGVEEVLARIAGLTYIMDANRIFTISAIDRNEQPAVPSAISKYHNTELGRRVIMDAMDIHGGKGICMGPRNYLAQPYVEMPIAITVEGANILTRSMIIFGQGAMRCHPYVLKEMLATQETDERKALKDFDKAIFGHLGFSISNFIRAFLLSLTGGSIAGVPDVGPLKAYYRQLTRLSACFALLSDMAMFSLGGDLKRRERLSARLGDVLSMIYLASAVFKRHYENGQPIDDIALVRWCGRYLIDRAYKQMYSIISNFPVRWLARIMRIVIFPTGLSRLEPNDKLGNKIAALLLSPTETRKRLAEGIYLKPESNNPVGMIEIALKKVIAAEDYEKKFHVADKSGKLKGYTFDEKLASAVEQEILTEEESEIIREAHHARLEIVAVDDFARSELENLHVK